MTTEALRRILPFNDDLQYKGGGEAMMHVRWETSTRYYEVRLMRDLFQDWVLVVSRGGKTNRLGALRTLFVSSKEEGIKMIATVEKVRSRRGYVRVPA